MTDRRFFFYAVMCAVMLLSCSSEKGEEIQTPPVEEKSPAGQAAPLQDNKADYSIKIEPQDGFRGTVFRLSSENFELSDAAVQWMASGVSVRGAEGLSFTLQDTGYGKGDTVQAKAVIDGKEVFSNTVQIKNSPPEFTQIRLMPEIFKHGDTLFVEAAVNDPDGDEVTIAYKWMRNKEPAGEGTHIESPLKSGDRISVTLIPFDGEEHGRPAVLDRKIENLPPMIMEGLEFNFDGKIYTHQVRAEDPEKGPLTYALKSAGENMSIDSETGLITWKVPPDFTGNAPVVVSVTDGHGGESTRALTFTINPPAVKEKDSSKEVQQSGNSPA